MPTRFIFEHDVVVDERPRRTFTLLPGKGVKGDPGPGVAAGGTSGQVLVKASATDYDTEWADPEVTKEQFAALEEYVRDMSPLETVGPAGSVSVADAAPLSAEQVAVEIEAVQDLHGYDHPWAAGGGKNLMPYRDGIDFVLGGMRFHTENGNLYINGTSTQGISSVSANFKDNFSTVLKAGTYTWASSVSLPSGAATFRKKADDTTLNAVFTLEEDTECYLGFYIPDSTTVNMMFPGQLELGSTATSYSPYSNICPISGWAGANVTHRGKNLLSSDVSDFVLGGPYLFLKDVVPKGQLARFTFTDKDTSVDISSCSIGFVYNDVSAGESAADYRWAISNGVIQNRVDNMSAAHAGVLCGNVFIYPNTLETVQKLYARYDIMVELGDTATAYEPYAGETYDISFPAGAGTVYGGTLTIDADGSGVLEVTEFGHVFDGTESMVSGGGRSDLAMIYFSGVAFMGWAYGAKRASSHFKDTNLYSWSEVPANQWLAAGGSYWGFGGYTPAEFAAYAAAQYANGTPITCYTSLATPITYTLTAEQIMLLRGVNNVWANCGDTALAYRADIPAYIDQRVNATRSMIAGIEAGMQATKAYSARDLLIVGDTLYKATTSIASGATFTPGTNVTATTVAEQLILLANA